MAVNRSIARSESVPALVEDAPAGKLLVVSKMTTASPDNRLNSCFINPRYLLDLAKGFFLSRYSNMTFTRR
jgi:hypothetical protein